MGFLVRINNWLRTSNELLASLEQKDRVKAVLPAPGSGQKDLNG